MWPVGFKIIFEKLPVWTINQDTSGENGQIKINLWTRRSLCPRSQWETWKKSMKTSPEKLNPQTGHECPLYVSLEINSWPWSPGLPQSWKAQTASTSACTTEPRNHTWLPDPSWMWLMVALAQQPHFSVRNQQFQPHSKVKGNFPLWVCHLLRAQLGESDWMSSLCY